MRACAHSLHARFWPPPNARPPSCARPTHPPTHAAQASRPLGFSAPTLQWGLSVIAALLLLPLTLGVDGTDW